jgi:glycerophosphoryl diester phosphodiesterase
MLARWWHRRDRPLVVGHRGVRGEGRPTENTLPAFEQAAEEGADAIELDVRVCRSGELVVLHDPTLSRVTGGADERAAADLDARELSRVALHAGAGVPTLAEVLAWARARSVRVNVEMKRDVPSRPAVVEATARLLSSWDPAHPVIVSSFDPFMLAALGACAPRVPRALLLHKAPVRERAGFLARPIRCDAVHIERTITTGDTIARWRRHGMLVAVWTVNHAIEARDVRDLGATAIITDRPREMRDAIESA